MGVIANKLKDNTQLYFCSLHLQVISGAQWINTLILSVSVFCD